MVVIVKVVVFGKRVSNLAKVAVLVEKLLYSGKVVVFGQRWL